MRQNTGKKSWLLETVIPKELRGTYLITRLKQQKAISNRLVEQKLKTSDTILPLY